MGLELHDHLGGGVAVSCTALDQLCCIVALATGPSDGRFDPVEVELHRVMGIDREELDPPTAHHLARERRRLAAEELPPRSQELSACLRINGDNGQTLV
ncbi:MAG: hypothetical protein AB7N61_13770 [Acidimicrobiia bacterium]